MLDLFSSALNVVLHEKLLICYLFWHLEECSRVFFWLSLCWFWLHVHIIFNGNLQRCFSSARSLSCFPSPCVQTSCHVSLVTGGQSWGWNTHAGWVPESLFTTRKKIVVLELSRIHLGIIGNGLKLKIKLPLKWWVRRSVQSSGYFSMAWSTYSRFHSF